jgi:hypothetical protein
VRPSLPMHHTVYGWSGNAHFVGDFCLTFSAFKAAPDLPHLSIGKFAVSVSFSAV